MRTINVLVSHDHHRSVPQIFSAGVLLPERQAHYFDDAGKLNIFHEHLGSHGLDVGRLSSQGIHSEKVSSQLLDSTQGQSLGGVSFCQDKAALITSPSLVGIFKLRDHQPILLRLLELPLNFAVLFKFGEIDDSFANASLHELPDELVGDEAGRAKAAGSGGEGLLGLRGEAGVFDKAVDEEVEMGLHLKRLDLNSLLFRKEFDEFGDYLIQDVVYVGAAPGG
jgi:hypothetical protein